MVASACPTIEIYGIDSWSVVEGRPKLSPTYCSQTLCHLGYLGYARWITGNPLSAFQRLRDSFISQLQLDLVLFRGELLGSEPFPKLAEIIPHVRAAGIIVVSWDFPDGFLSFWRELEESSPELKCVQINDTTGLVLK